VRTVAQLTDKIENVLNETRILVLGIQILIGFEFRSFFEPGYKKMVPYTRQIQLAALALMLVGLVVLMIPAAYHRIVLHGRNAGQLHRLGNTTVSLGLASGLLVFFYGAWFGYTFWVKYRAPDQRLTESHVEGRKAA